MTEKNTQNAVVPTKGTRQYKHTPKPPNRHISKIFALVACLVLLVTFTIPASASLPEGKATNEAIENMRYASSLVPTSIAYSAYDGTTDGVVYSELNPVYYYNGTTQSTTRYQYIEGQGMVGDAYLDSIRIIGGDDIATLTLTPYSGKIDPVTYSYVKVYYNDVTYNPSNIDYNARTVLRYSDATDFIYIVNGTYLDETNVARDFGVTFAEEAVSYATVPNIQDIYVKMNYPENATITFSSIEVVCLPRTQDGSDVDTRFLNATVQYNPLVPMSEAEASYYENISVIRYKEVVNSRTFSDMLDWLGDVLEGFLSTPLFKIGNLTISIAVILATILGLLFVFTFLRFFSGG